MQRWTVAARFRRQAFGWRSQPAVKQVREAVSEIKKAAHATEDILLLTEYGLEGEWEG